MLKYKIFRAWIKLHPEGRGRDFNAYWDVLNTFTVVKGH